MLLSRCCCARANHAIMFLKSFERKGCRVCVILPILSTSGTRKLHKDATLKAHLHPNGLATVCYCFQMVLLFFSRSDWFPEYSCERENCHVNSKQIAGSMSQRFTLRSCSNLRPQFTNLKVFMKGICSPKMLELSDVRHVKVSMT